MEVGPSPINPPSFIVLARQQQVDDLPVSPTEYVRYQYGDATVFQISSEFTNLRTLPFTPVCSGSNRVPGQNISASSGSISFQAVPLTQSTTVTLMP